MIASDGLHFSDDRSKIVAEDLISVCSFVNLRDVILTSIQPYFIDLNRMPELFDNVGDLNDRLEPVEEQTNHTFSNDDNNDEMGDNSNNSSGDCAEEDIKISQPMRIAYDGLSDVSDDATDEEAEDFLPVEYVCLINRSIKYHSDGSSAPYPCAKPCAPSTFRESASQEPH